LGDFVCTARYHGTAVTLGQNGRVRIHPEVAAALADGRPVVALESTIISHGLPKPDNLEVASDIEDAVRSAGALPATVAIIEGDVHVGLDPIALERIASSTFVAKTSVRDLAVVAARRSDGATTVAATIHIAARAGITVCATGGLGGVHRDWQDTYDESADLTTLAETPVVIVCAGVKSLLDVGATLERLETLSVPVLGYRTDTFPGFYVADSGYSVPWRVDSPADIAAVFVARHEMGTDRYGVVLANPIPADHALEPRLHDRILAAGLAAAADAGVRGKDVTPFLLDFIHRETDGASLRANVALILANARLAAEVAVEVAAAELARR
jgi:pseudouridylate synthase